MQTIGQALVKLRSENGYNRSVVAKAINCTGATYSKVEKDEREVSFVMMYRICRFYEISMYEFADMISPGELERSDLTIIRMQEKRSAKMSALVIKLAPVSKH